MPTKSKTQIISRHDIEYAVAFILGVVTPFLASWVANAVTTPIWSLTISDDAPAAQVNTVLVNSILFATLALVYVGIFLALVLAARWIKVYSRIHGTALSVGLVGLFGFFGSTLPVALYRPELQSTLYLDLLDMSIFGLGYALGWWAVRRYAKL